MIEKTNSAITFRCFFVAAKQGVPGLTVTVDIYRPDGTRIVTGAAASELAAGIYFYVLDSSYTAAAGEYVAIFTTTDETVDLQTIPSIWTVGRAGVNNLDAAISSRLAGGSYSAPPSAATTAGAVRTELAIELARLDAAISSRSIYAGADTGGTTTLLARLTSPRAGLLDNLDAAITTRLAAAGYTAPSNASIATIATAAAAIQIVTDRLNTALALSGGNYRFTTAALALAPTGSGGGGGSGLDQETIDKLTAASQILLAAPYVPADAPARIIPAPSDDDTMGTVYLYTEAIDGTKRAGITIKITLSGRPTTVDGRLLDTTAKTLSTDAEGFAQLALERTDLMLPAGRTYLLTCSALGLKDKAFTLTTDTLDLATLVA